MYLTMFAHLCRNLNTPSPPFFPTPFHLPPDKMRTCQSNGDAENSFSGQANICRVKSRAQQQLHA